MKKIGIYIHIPFCKQRCYYCDFCSTVEKENTQNQYVDAVISEIENYKEKKSPIDIKNEKFFISTIYFGGGTPSLIDEGHIIRILKKIKSTFEVVDDAEITIEINPGTVNEKKLRKYYDNGINRISFGLQTTNDEIMNKIGRIHNYSQFEEAYDTAKRVGFSNINVDLMIGLPTQTIDDVTESVNKIIEKRVQHISVYSLILEEGTALEKKVNSNELQLPNEDEERAMYWIVKKSLEQNGFKHYEISNFALKDFESKHNLDCWNQKEYFGFGLAAHSYISDIRFSNLENMQKYIENIEKNEWWSNVQIHEIQTFNDKINEYVILKLRTLQGININEFYKNFKIDFMDTYEDKIKKLIDQGLLVQNNEFIKLSDKGIDLANIVWCEFI